MSDKNHVLILIPARAGSKRVRNKNLRLLGLKHLVGFQIETAIKSRIGRVIVSTDSEEIAALGKHYGAEIPFYRPDQLSGDKATSLSVIDHALTWLAEHELWVPEIVAFCPPTNPFLKPETLRSMLELLESRPEVNSIVTITEALTHPFRIVMEADGGRFENWQIEIDGKRIIDVDRTQDWPKVWEGSPACRMTRSNYFRAGDRTSEKTYDVSNFIGFKIPNFEAMDIDNEFDFAIAEAMIRGSE